MVGDDGQITLETERKPSDAMNRFVQALTDIGSMLGDLAEEGGAVLFRR